MKNVLTIIMTLALLMSFVTVASAQVTTVAFGVTSAEGVVGDTVTVDVTVSEAHYLTNAQIKIVYDPTALALVPVYVDDPDAANIYCGDFNEAILPEGSVAELIQPQAGRLLFAFASPSKQGRATGGTLFTLTFTILDGAKATNALTMTVPELNANETGEGRDDYPEAVVTSGAVTLRPTTGVNKIGEDYYYVNADGSYKTGTFWVTATGANGLVSAGYVYADETGRFYNNEFYTIDGALYYLEKGQPTTNTGVRELGGDLYSLNHKGAVNIGEIWVTEAGANGLVTEGYCYTDEAGRFYHHEFATVNGERYYMVKGRPVSGEGGVREVDGELYYVSWKGTVLTGTVYVSNPNGYTVKGNHYTDETGRFYNNEFVTLDGTLYYMVKGRPMQNGGGVEEIGGNLYYITWKGTVLTGEIYVTNPNGYTVKGNHYTDETGRFYNEESVTLSDGNRYYIVNGRIYNTPGVKEIDGGLYYITWEGPIATGKVYVTYTNGLIETTGWHYTDETGRFLNNEFTTDDGKIYYIVDGAVYSTKGVLEVDGNYYYVSYNNSIVVNGPVKITEANSNGYDVPAGKYTTDVNGVIIL